MPAWPRDIEPKSVTDFSYPGALKSRSQSGKWNLRSNTAVGRAWEETYLVPVNSDSGKKFLATIRQYWREGTIFTISHYDYLTPRGAAIGTTAIVDGTLQTGGTLTVDGASASISNWLIAGDIFTVTGVNHAFDVMATVDTDASGNAEIPVSPPFYTGNSPADNATLTISAVAIRAIIADAPDMPNTDATDYGLVKVRFAEAP
jgi:hypothetical protein